MKVLNFTKVFNNISKLVKEEKDYLIKLDQAFGDGDLGISMTSGFEAVSNMTDLDEDFGRYFLAVSKTFNESAPSSLGTILSFFFMGIAKCLKGKNEINLEELQEAFVQGVELIKTKASSERNQKTIIDALEPGVLAFAEQKTISDAIKAGIKASEEGMESTKDMMAVHGRAAYHKEKTLGHIDGGAYLAYLMFKSQAE